jgi:hypothetical protein
LPSRESLFGKKDENISSKYIISKAKKDITKDRNQIKRCFDQKDERFTVAEIRRGNVLIKPIW